MMEVCTFGHEVSRFEQTRQVRQGVATRSFLRNFPQAHEDTSTVGLTREVKKVQKAILERYTQVAEVVVSLQIIEQIRTNSIAYQIVDKNIIIANDWQLAVRIRFWNRLVINS